MPSYRITLGVGALRAGTDPQTVLPAAAAAARELTVVEAWDLAVVRGEPRITVRFTADDDEGATHVGRHTNAVVETLADVLAPQLTRRWGARWYPVR
ncbi:hypothetical protein DDP54_03185 [Cellulomonas sp. WB94]|uniref:hypothetical protein n=1 Tax=Cellulomonas sp. WB94 TaxID=2173174 RepID=UPI000D56AC7E|nr:hypothetical protein [Cellulomonas sp. WB94]PVU82176.1 hypothetical protein DDP54_03185 [Cellulomonas sp. WB94]